MAVLSLQDAMHRYFLSKIGDGATKGSQKLLADGSAFNTAAPVISSSSLGTPDSIILFLRTDTSGTFQVYLSPDGLDWYHDTANDQTVTGGQEKVAKIPGAAYIKIVASTNMAHASIRTQANYG